MPKSAFWQLYSYILVGVISNLFGYIVFLVITHFIFPPIITMSLMYSVSCVVGYLGNKKWTFSGISTASSTFLKYVLVQLSGYATNLFLLVLLYSKLGIPYQAVQFAAIFVVALQLFILRKFYVFRSITT